MVAMFWMFVIGIFVGYWIGMFTAIRRVSKARRDGRVIIDVKPEGA